jgi:hypothetical protein
MNAAARAPSLGAGIAAAAALSVAGAGLLAALTPFAGYGVALRFVVAALGLAYSLFVMAQSRERVGRVTTVALWIATATAAWLAHIPLAPYVLLHVGLVWLVRSLYRYGGLAPACGDFVLTALSVAIAVSAAGRSGSAWLALWCFFFAQAFVTLIPGLLGARDAGGTDSSTAFDRAQRAADAAVRRMSGAR